MFGCSSTNLSLCTDSNHGLSEATSPTPSEYARGLPLSCALVWTVVCGQVGVTVDPTWFNLQGGAPTLQYSTTIMQSDTN